MTNLQGKLNPLWISYNNELYALVVRNFAEALHKVDPNAMVVNTHGDFGPGGAHSLPRKEQMEWAKYADITMPQWYGMREYSFEYDDLIIQGDTEKLYGKVNGYTDVIPLLNVSMGAGLEDPMNFRFKMFDFISTSPAVKGVGYYVGTNAFTDGKYMVQMSGVHTLLADVEEYYAKGARADSAATFAQQPGGVQPIVGMDEQGQQMTVTPEVATAVRVHTLGSGGRAALLTVISHCNRGVGESGTIRLDLRRLGVDPARYVLIDHIGQTVAPLTATVAVDTTKHNMALLEIADRTVAARFQKAWQAQ